MDNTANYDLPLFDDSDHPTWRGHWNPAMVKMDETLASQDIKIANQNVNVATALRNSEEAVSKSEAATQQIATAVNAANEAKETSNAAIVKSNEAYDKAVEVNAKADQAASSALAARESADNAEVSAEDAKAGSIQAAASAQSANSRASEAINIANSALAKFPVATENIGNGSVTATKLAMSAIATILGGLKIRYFDSKDPTADNDGMIVPADCSMSGFYIEDFNILVLNEVASSFGTVIGNYENPSFFLPGYVPRVSKRYRTTSMAFIVYTSSDAFYEWSGLNIMPNGGVAPNSSYPQQGAAHVLISSQIIYLTPFTNGSEVGAQSFNDHADENGLL